jgi:nucleotide-binding universal stress UspA family protein
MEKFSVKFRAGGLDLDAVVAADEQHGQFTAEIGGSEPEPVLLAQLANEEWEVVRRGSRGFSEVDLRNLERAIEVKIKEIYGVKNILVLTDFSDAAENAARYAAALTHQLKAERLLLYHSYASIVTPSTSFAQVPWRYDGTPASSLEGIKELKDAIDGTIPEYTKLETIADAGVLLPTVNELGYKHSIGLVVAGITGKSNLEKTLIGSNTLSLAKFCKFPLLIVPPEAVFRPIKKIVFACDLKQVSSSTPVYAIKTFVRSIGAKLFILNVDQDEMHFNPERIGEMTALHQLWDREEPEFHYIDDTDTAHGIMAFADRYQADLVITVPKVYGFFEGIFHSSMTKKLAYHTHLPLLLFKDE